MNKEQLCLKYRNEIDKAMLTIKRYEGRPSLLPSQLEELRELRLIVGIYNGFIQDINDLTEVTP